ncbi:tyrosine recombinase [Anaerocolumna sp. AGMB13020]|uniref:tyrosine recombinase n=1 Tax=Anaerocolumna sp. AGMB13020 TaxID=3081750 RepID=UPI002952D85F|nr:tyrosine recombinase [Anaerocolumna sp. AGMB13020]WOO36469.1 tyrosine recombinase [Anaerocolumna sp. AGMB13020]
MKAALQEFITYMTEVKNASVNTCLSYKNDLTKLINYMYKQNITEEDKISETSLNSYVLTLEKEGLSPATVSRNIASIKAFILYLIKHGKMKHDPTERMKSPKIEKKPHTSLSTEEVSGLLDQPNINTIKGMRDKAMLELLYATGIRVTELISIKLEDLNLKNRFLRCAGAKKERLIPFGNMAKHALENYFSFGRPNLVGSVSTDFLFTNLSGEPMSRQGFWKLLKSYGKNAGITMEITPQILRNSFAAHMIENGADLRSIQEFLGHADISTTQFYLQSGDRKLTKVYTDTHPRA